MKGDRNNNGHSPPLYLGTVYVFVRFLQIDSVAYASASFIFAYHKGYWVHVTLSGILKEKTERFNQFRVRTPKYTMKIMGQFFRFL